MRKPLCAGFLCLAGFVQLEPSLLPALAGIFRSGPRTPSNPSQIPPSSYARGLQPVASGDVRGNNSLNGVSPRHSKTNLDFESALRAEGTVLLKEGIDVSALGVVDKSPTATPRRPAGSNNNSSNFNTTPVVVPPTPEARQPSGSGSSARRPPSPAPSEDELELQNKRRSMFRSPGTASSPDLATLLRKAKENGGVVANGGSRQEGGELLVASESSGAGFLSPDQSSHRLRGSSSTSSFSVVSASSATAPRTPVKDPGPHSASNGKRVEMSGPPEERRSDWSMTSPRARSGSKSGKSMRSRASNFFGKMLGSDNARDRSRTDYSYPSTPSTPIYTAPPLFSQFTSPKGTSPPPVPRLPDSYRSPGPSSPPGAADVFQNMPSSPYDSKPLPPISKGSKPTSEEEIERAIAQTGPTPSPTPERAYRPRPREGHTRANGSTSSGRRRSASVGDLEWQKAMMDTQDTLPLPGEPRRPGEQGKASTEWDTNGIMSLFKGELSQLDPISSASLEIKDPSTPQRRVSPNRARSNSEQTLPVAADGRSTIRPKLPGAISLPVHPTVGTLTDDLQTTPESPTAKRSPVSPKRYSMISSGDTTIRPSARRTTSRTTPPVSASALYASPRTVSSPLLGIPTPTTPPSKARSPVATPSFTNPFLQHPSAATNANGSSSRETVQPHAGASTSDPVLESRDQQEPGPRRSSQPHININTQTPEFQRTVRLVPSATSFGYPSNAQASGSASQVDIGVNDASPGKPPTNISQSLGRGSSLEGEELEAKGRELAQRCWVDDESFLPKEKIAEWLGGTGRVNAAALHHYVEYYDFVGLRLDHAFRRFCGKLYLKGETQQIDRILSEFSRRFWECNPTSIYGSASVVHAVAYSILLLNTDLHIADLSTHMSRNQFVRNTVQAIQSQIRPSGPSFARASTPDLTYDDASSAHARSEGSDAGGSTVRSRSKRSSSVHSWTSISREALPPLGTPGMSNGQLTTSPTGPSSLNASTVSVQTPTSGQISNSAAEPRIRTAGSQSSSSVTSIVYGRNWDVEMESMLRDMYSAIKSQEIRQPTGFQLPTNQMSTLAPNTPYNTLMRHRSQRGQPDRMAMLKRGSIRGIQNLLQQAGASPYSSNSSIEVRDPRDGRVSPSPSFATSLDGIPTNSTFFTPALGFASNLSHTIIRETQEDDIRSICTDGSADTSVSISDEELALLGAPWAKEGMLCRKQYWESAGKRAKSKAWQDVFVVIQTGELNMFIFGEGGAGGAEIVGGGNWLANAHPVGNVVLAHSLAHVLPPPGYNRQRPHCFVLTLASGGVYFFQAGTEDLLNEWVSTCNYWAARQSKEPLSGGVSNMEYGWNRVLDPVTHTSTIHDDNASLADPSDSFSMRSGRSQFKKRSWPDPGTIGRSSDRTFVNEWKPPMPSTVSSTHDEETQLEALQKQVASLKTDLQTHNELQQPMSALYAPRSTNLNKAQSNWEKKSQHLLTEIVKYETYVESLKTGMSLRLKKRGEKALEKALVTASPDQEDFAIGSKRHITSFSEEDTILEEPSTPGPTSGFNHRREVAQVDEDEETP